MKQAWIARAKRFATYALVGCFDTGMDWVAFTTAHELLHFTPVICQAIGYFVGTVCSYFLNGRITFRDGHYTHRFLRVTQNGVPLPPEQLDTPTRFRADDYLRVVQDAYLRLHGWTNGLPPVPPSPLCLNVTESEAAEMLSFLFDTGIAGCTREEWRKKDFIHYFCRAWNLPPNKDYDTLMSHVKSRPNPTTFLDKIKRMYLDHIEQKDCNRQ